MSISMSALGGRGECSRDANVVFDDNLRVSAIWFVEFHMPNHNLSPIFLQIKARIRKIGGGGTEQQVCENSDFVNKPCVEALYYYHTPSAYTTLHVSL